MLMEKCVLVEKKKKEFTNELNMDLPLEACVEKIVDGVVTHGSEIVQGAVSVKKVILTVFGDMKRPIIMDFLEKGATVNNASHC